MEKNGRIVFYGHATRSAEIASSILERMGYSVEERKQIFFVISHHDDFISWVLPTDEYDHQNPFLIEIGIEIVREYISQVLDVLPINKEQLYRIITDLLALCIADASAQAEIVIIANKIVDTKEHKICKIKLIRSIVEDLYK